MAIRTFQVQKKTSRLDKYLVSCCPDLSRATIQRLIKGGKAQVNRLVVWEKNLNVKPGDQILLDYSPPRLEASAGRALVKVYEDQDVLVVDKPAGLVMHPTPSRPRESLAGILLATVPKIAFVGEDRLRPGLVHRLDADTSGLVVAAKNQAAYNFLKTAFASRQVIKQYSALVHGKLPSAHGIFNQPIGRRPGRKKFEVGFGREAKTEYWREAYYARGVDPHTKRARASAHESGQKLYSIATPRYGVGVDQLTLVRVQLHTGRTHQIRAHFAAAGHPVAGDNLYGGRFKKKDADLFPRQFLHATYLKLRLPSGEVKEITSPLPQDLQSVLNQLKEIN